MVQWHMKSDRKVSGGRRRTSRRSTKKLAWKGNLFSQTRLSEKEERVEVNGRGSTAKRQVRYAIHANITDLSTKKTSKAKILTIAENNANRQYARRNIITKGAIIEVELNGKKHAKVVSRPGQHGTINAVLVEFTESKPKKQKRKHNKTEKKHESKKTEENSKTKPVESAKETKTETKKEIKEEKKEKETKEKSKKTEKKEEK